MGRKSQHDSVHIHPIFKAFFFERGGGQHTIANKDHFPVQLTHSSNECAIASGQFNTDYSSQQTGSQSDIYRSQDRARYKKNDDHTDPSGQAQRSNLKGILVTPLEACPIVVFFPFSFLISFFLHSEDRVET